MALSRLPAFLTTPADADTPAVSPHGNGLESDAPPGGSSGQPVLIMGFPADQVDPASMDDDMAGGSPAAAVAGTSGQVDSGTDSVTAPPAIASGMEHYERLQRRLLVATALAIATAVPISGWFYDGPTALSLLLGGVAGLLYLRLLARSVSRLGGDRRSVGKVQLLVPVVLVLASARIPSLQILPALVGFLLYKPALIVQALLDR
jgi:ATP synthase protein I